MLVYFSVSPDEIRFNWRTEAADDGGHVDHALTLPKGEPFGNLSYEELSAEGGGTIFVDEQTRAGEILKPGDPKLNPSFKVNILRAGQS